MKIVKVVTTTTTTTTTTATVFRKQLQEEEQVFLLYIWHIFLLGIFNLYIILSLIELFSLMFIAANRAQRKCSLSPQLRSALHGKSSQITSLNGSLIFFENAIEITSGKAFRLFSEHRKRFISLNSSLSKEKNRNKLIMIKFPDMNLA